MSRWMAEVVSLTLLVLLPACAPGGGAPDEQTRAPTPDLGAFRVVDLSHAFDEKTLYWPTSPSRFESDTLSEGYTEGGFYYLAKRFRTPEHGGTHLDAPVHFLEQGWSVDEIPLDRLLVPAVVIDMVETARQDPDYRLAVSDVEAWEARHGAVPEGSAVLLRTGWDRHWPDEAAYYGRPDGGAELDLHFPAFGAEAARLLVEKRGVALLGVDTASIDYGPSSDFIVHQIAAAANVVALENVTGLDELPPTGAWIVALPLKISGGSGGPVRIAGLVPR